MATMKKHLSKNSAEVHPARDSKNEELKKKLKKLFKDEIHSEKGTETQNDNVSCKLYVAKELTALKNDLSVKNKKKKISDKKEYKMQNGKVTKSDYISTKNVPEKSENNRNKIRKSKKTKKSPQVLMGPTKTAYVPIGNSPQISEKSRPTKRKRNKNGQEDSNKKPKVTDNLLPKYNVSNIKSRIDCLNTNNPNFEEITKKVTEKDKPNLKKGLTKKMKKPVSNLVADKVQTSSSEIKLEKRKKSCEVNPKNLDKNNELKSSHCLLEPAGKNEGILNLKKKRKRLQGKCKLQETEEHLNKNPVDHKMAKILENGKVVKTLQPYQETNADFKTYESTLCTFDRNNEESSEDEESFSELEDDSFSDDSFFEEMESEDTDVEFSSDYSYEESSDYFFDSDDDDDYDEDYTLPVTVEEDMYIPQGIATKYEIHKDMNIKFDSDSNEAQIIEIPTESKKRRSDYPKVANNNQNIEDNTIFENDINSGSENSCPTLVPIDNADNNINYQVNAYDDTMSDFDSDDISDSYSDYSEVTEGSLCVDYCSPVEEVASKMTPEIIKLDKKSKLQDFYMCTTSDQDSNENSQTCNVLEEIYNNSLNPNNSFEVLTVGSNTSNASYSKTTSIVKEKTINFHSKFYNAINSRHVLVLLKNPITIYGTLKLQLIAGDIEIFGYKPNTDEILEIYSPRGYSFLSIKPCKSRINFFQENILKLSKTFLSSDLEEILENFNSKTDGVILLERNDDSKKVDTLRKFMKQNLFPNLNSILLERPHYSSEFILRCIIHTHTENSLKIDPKWNTINLLNTTKLMVIGGKSVGKSSVIRYLINKNLKEFGKILLIDLDIGQSEIFLPQTISATLLNKPLLGPGYFLGLQPDKSIVHGDINVVLSPKRYLNNVRDLLQYCIQNENFENIPWIVNTMGYNKGFGCELIAAISQFVRPTDILQLQSQKYVNNFHYLMEKEILCKIPNHIFSKEDLYFKNYKTGSPELLEHLDYRLIIMESALQNQQDKQSGNKEWEMYAKDSRHAMIITRLGNALSERYDWLTDIKPICASADELEIIHFTDDNLEHDELLDVINANMVYLCNKQDEDRPIECYGIGIVRAIDRFQRKIFLLPSISLELMANVNCLAICNMPLPTSVLLNQGPKIKDIVPYAYNTNEFAASKSVTHFHRPKLGSRQNNKRR